MKHWTELRTALLLARLGTVSQAAEALGIHRATVNRHVDLLESALQTRLFLRHARGYTLTDAGQDMLEVADRADTLFSELEGRSQGRAGILSGHLRISALAGVVPLIIPAIHACKREFPGIDIEVVTENRLAQLEYGEAHVAFRAGPKPDIADYVVRHFRRIRFSLYANAEYAEHMGPLDLDQPNNHRFVGTLNASQRLPFSEWMHKHIQPASLMLDTDQFSVVRAAVLDGMGIGFLADFALDTNDTLVDMAPEAELWSSNLWIVTHGDLHRTRKVQAFLNFVRD